MKQTKYKELLSLVVIEAARAGDVGAVEQILNYYSSYINKLCTRTLYDKDGALHVRADEVMRRHLQAKLTQAIVKK